MILALPVCCITPESQVFCHSGYELPEIQVKDLHNLRQAFGVDLPADQCLNQSGIFSCQGIYRYRGIYDNIYLIYTNYLNERIEIHYSIQYKKPGVKFE